MKTRYRHSLVIGEAATLLASLAERAEPAPWSSRYNDQPDCHMYGDYGWTVQGAGVEAADSEAGKATADLIAAMDPQTAERIAEWLARHQAIAADNEREQEIDGMEWASYGVDTEHAITVARAILGRAYG